MTVQTPMFCVSATQVHGWCDEKVAPVILAVENGSDEALFEALENATLSAGNLSNFLSLPFTKNSVQGQRLLRVWENVQQAYPKSAIAETFVWKFWRPLYDSVNAHMLNEATREPWLSPETAKAYAYAFAFASVRLGDQQA